MLKLTLKPGEYIDIGADVRVIFSGGSANNIHLLVDAPRELNIVRNTAGRGKETSYYKEQGISEDAKRRIRDILRSEKESMQKNGTQAKTTKPSENVYVVRNR